MRGRDSLDATASELESDLSMERALGGKTSLSNLCGECDG